MNVLGFDDGPFPRDHRGDILLVGVVCAGTRIDGVVSGRIRRDGANATRVMVDLVRSSQFGEHLQAIMLQGIAVGGFNVVDIHGLSKALNVPVLVVTRRAPDMNAVRRALFGDATTKVTHGRPRVLGASRKWKLIEDAGTMEELLPSRRAIGRALADEGARSPQRKTTRGARMEATRPGPTGLPTGFPRLWIQRAGLSMDDARRLVEDTTLHGNVPEPLRIAHLVAGGLTTGRSRGRA